MKKIYGELAILPVVWMESLTKVRLKRTVMLGRASTKTSTTFSGSGISLDESGALNESSTVVVTNPVSLLLKKTHQLALIKSTCIGSFLSQFSLQH